jgi:hypothetical protein
MEGLLKDIRYSIRGFRKRPGFTLLVVLVLAFAIAANSSIFSIVNAVILKPLSFKDPNHLVLAARKFNLQLLVAFAATALLLAAAGLMP